MSKNSNANELTTGGQRYVLVIQADSYLKISLACRSTNYLNCGLVTQVVQ
jgi:hypothetical protein